MDENELCAKLLPFAKRVARSMTRDVEADSAAGIATLRAVRTFNGSIPIERWVARWVKIVLWNGWRKQKVRAKVWATDPQTETFSLCEMAIAPPEEEDAGFLTLSVRERQLLTDYYINKWPLDVIQRRYQFSSRNATRIALRVLVQRFQDAINA